MKLCCRQAARTAQLSLSPGQKLEMRRNVEALAKTGKHLEACVILEQLVSVSPHNPLIWNDLGVEYEASGQIEKAIAALRRGYEADATYPPILYNLGKFTFNHLVNLERAGEFSRAEAQRLLDKAIKFLNANLDRDPENADAHYYLALAYAMERDEQRADAHMTVAIRMKEELQAPLDWLLK
jgi:tetratricopeptide (TPR) repeat protein